MIPLERVLEISNILDWLLINLQHPLGSIVMFQTSIFQVKVFRGVIGYLKLGSNAARRRYRCRITILPKTLPTRQLRPCLLSLRSSLRFLSKIYKTILFTTSVDPIIFLKGVHFNKIKILVQFDVFVDWFSFTVFPHIVSMKLFFFEFGNPKVTVQKAKGHNS